MLPPSGADALYRALGSRRCALPRRRRCRSRGWRPSREEVVRLSRAVDRPQQQRRLVPRRRFSACRGVRIIVVVVCVVVLVAAGFPLDVVFRASTGGRGGGGSSSSGGGGGGGSGEGFLPGHGLGRHLVGRRPGQGELLQARRSRRWRRGVRALFLLLPLLRVEPYLLGELPRAHLLELQDAGLLLQREGVRQVPVGLQQRLRASK